MGRYLGPKDRLSRRENFDLFGKGSKITRLSVPPGMHGHKGTRKVSEYGSQLREKQKVKRMYGLMERQLRKYIGQALKTLGNTTNVLFALLERRLDNVVFRLGFAPTRPAARQLVSHRHVTVNGKVVNIPSYQVEKDNLISLTAKGVKVPSTKLKLEAKDHNLPDWLQKKALVGKVSRLPIRDDVQEEIDDAGVIEFYSR
ncbi:30S ribosomal protein S4 [Candidatus Woesebacteria bacterium RIFCSPHIGHO2_02_FULL_42_20]|uniref:Small ribosomal subunit protein uS4 n=1 Tax=Candidatus Woesebacteria bacterium RIFCSPHIGHO2_12_FULL_41_24 TaxID=1802510 RepID=A0A1F8AR37_9BACT|nr:MAG: 30S ribosomal protein S4 [Candidatus Woesebacteria bacterium RBG_16_41_13]OGM29258.1 MAG: 30S ribosomal protein S4 [Candidatus Woesebacteria bacterium RIFCSPHIGHO2_01_FULL_42_80]OGM34758.1 MAG: 30S ribosomal protein S4 [Candidatus Woesebacteria bacterium RIFCSPHIGHO2_02_FULL_42_20]OGM53655.1 MAG: 30S ribosomal protein S4 [Candidatus Woesebacteria bacterium RIFCSPHIGHO2_12_FULL_41_24]OGM67055.1 MAG: 30S ribosomal protein S4 [Candidatus Woesebacteria bacterium RIFCSPLOWO2_01_FULL_42_67]O